MSSAPPPESVEFSARVVEAEEAYRIGLLNHLVPREQLRSEVWVMEKNSNYWNKGLPYLEGVEFYHVLPFSPEMASAILAGRVDYIRATDPVTTRKAKATQGMSSDNRRNRWASDDTFLSRSATTRL